MNKILPALAFLPLLAGCQTYSGLQRWLSHRLAPTPSPRPSASPSGAPGGLTTEAGKRAQANAELLQEVYRVVYVQEVRDRAAYGSLVDSLNQGASIEGVYNGLIHSDNYRQLEIHIQGAKNEALRTFAEELAAIELELPTPRELTSVDARPLQVLGGEPPQADLVFGKAKPTGKPDAATLARQYEALFARSSIFTLKRVLTDEALAMLDIKKKDTLLLAKWYGPWAARLAGAGVDFGVPLRNRADEAFHESFARQASYDRLLWEVLNRLHRLLNARQMPAAAASPSPGPAPSPGASPSLKGASR